VRLGELTSLPFPDASFDYVASLDVIGHVSFEEKDQVLCEIKRVLKPGGVTLHGIECLDPTVHKSYEEMSAEELRRFVAVDGHIGLERGEEHAARFGRIFKHVLFEPRYILCLSSEEFIKQADEYDLAYDADFLEYLRNLSPSERRAFDIAMGYVFNRISDLHIKLPSVGLYAFLKASDSELGPFYNEHRDRSNVLGPSAKIGSPHGDAPIQVTTHETSDRPSRTFWLDLSPDLDKPMRADFDDGWYAPDILPPVARWMRERARIKFEARDVRCLTLDLTTHLPDLSPTNHQEVHVSLNGVEVAALSIFRYGWLQLRLPIPEALRCAPNNLFELTLRASRTFKPRPDLTENRDDRDLSIAVCNIGVEVAGLPDP
jgi:SAM-dependent methyltransferase